MTWQANQNDLGTLEDVDKKVAAIRDVLRAITELDGVKRALELVDQLDDAVQDIAADVEMELHERGTQKGR
jgi:hypothetical protein